MVVSRKFFQIFGTSSGTKILPAEVFITSCRNFLICSKRTEEKERKGGELEKNSDRAQPFESEVAETRQEAMNCEQKLPCGENSNCFETLSNKNFQNGKKISCLLSSKEKVTQSTEAKVELLARFFNSLNKEQPGGHCVANVIFGENFRLSNCIIFTNKFY